MTFEAYQRKNLTNNLTPVWVYIRHWIKLSLNDIGWLRHEPDIWVYHNFLMTLVQNAFTTGYYTSFRAAILTYSSILSFRYHQPQLTLTSLHCENYIDSKLTKLCIAYMPLKKKLSKITKLYFHPYASKDEAFKVETLYLYLCVY